MLDNPFIKVQVSLNYQTGHVIQWWIDPNFTGKAPYQFTLSVYQDVSFTEPLFEIVAGENFFALDDTNLKQNHLNTYMYKVKLKTADNKVFLSDFTGWQPSDVTTRHKYLMAAEVTRKAWVRLRQAGLFGYLLKRKGYSPLATSELDPVTGEPVIDSSKGSYGVGIEGGFYKPVLFKYTLEARNTATEYQPEGRGTTYKEELKCRTVGFPYIDSHDVLVSAEGKRYSLSDAVETFFPGTTVSIQQMFTAQIVPNTDTIYSIQTPQFPNE